VISFVFARVLDPIVKEQGKRVRADLTPTSSLAQKQK
jgi:hypothetical protein